MVMGVMGKRVNTSYTPSRMSLLQHMSISRASGVGNGRLDFLIRLTVNLF